MVSCADKNDFSTAYSPSLSMHYLHMENQSFTLDGNGASTSMKVYSKSTPWQFQGMASWLMAQPAHGNSDETVSFKGEINPSGADIRTSIFAFESTAPTYEYSRSIAATQGAATPYLRIADNQTSLRFPASSHSLEIRVEANIDWSINGLENYPWLHVSVADDKKSLTVTVDENLTNDKRSAVFTLSNVSKYVSVSINVYQERPNIQTGLKEIPLNNEGHTIRFELTTDVAWTASSFSETGGNWLQISPESGSAGTSLLTVEVTPNEGTSERRAHIYINVGAYRIIDIPVNQEGIALRLEPNELRFYADAERQSLHVESNTGWSVIEKPEWIKVEPASGKGTVDVSVVAEANWDTKQRTGILKIGRQGTVLEESVRIVQNGRWVSNLIGELEFEATESSQEIDLETDGKWRVHSEDDWIAVTPEEGTGSSKLMITVKENPGENDREGSVTVTVGEIPKTIKVIQKGKYFTFDGNGLVELPSTGGTHQIHISSNERWKAYSTSSWMLLSKNSGTGDVDLTLTATDNPSVNSRSDTTTIEPTYLQPVRVITKQAARYLEVDAIGVNFFAVGGESEKIAISTDGTYSIESLDTWISCKTVEGEHAFIVVVDSYNGTESRESKVVISLTGLVQGEERKIEIPVRQRAYNQHFDVETFEDDQQWDMVSGGNLSLKVVGFGIDKSWDNFSSSTFTVKVSGFTDDKSWDNEYSSGITINGEAYKDEKSWD